MHILFLPYEGPFCNPLGFPVQVFDFMCRLAALLIHFLEVGALLMWMRLSSALSLVLI